MSYFDDQFEAWMENDCQGNPEDMMGDDIAEAFQVRHEREKEAKKKKGKNN